MRLYQNLKLVLFEIVLREWEDKSHLEYVCKSYICGKGQTCRIYKELSKFNTGISHFSEVHFMWLCFYKRPMLVYWFSQTKRNPKRILVLQKNGKKQK